MTVYRSYYKKNRKYHCILEFYQHNIVLEKLDFTTQHRIGGMKVNKSYITTIPMNKSACEL